MGRPRRLTALIGAIALVLGACGVTQRTSGRAARQESGAASGASPTPANAGTADDALSTVRIHRLRLKAGGEKGGGRLRVLVNNSTPQLRVTLTGNIDQEENAVTVCSVTDDTSLPPSTQCVLPVAGRAVDLPTGPGIKGAEISLAGRSLLVELEEIALTYTAVDRRVRFLLPNLDPSLDDASCLPKGCPSFEVTPARNGKLSAQASWNDPGSGLLDIRTAVPVPKAGISPTPPAYRVLSSSTSSSSTGPGSVSISATVQSDQQSLLALTNNGEGPLGAPTLEATWP